jgi:hypothetical protein
MFIGCNQFAVYRDQWFDPRMEAQSTRNSRNPLRDRLLNQAPIPLSVTPDTANRDYQEMN